MTEHPLIAFLRARLDEDEQVARHASDGPWVRHVGYISGGPRGVVIVAQQAQIWNAAHIVRHDPARVLREVEAKRRIIDEYERYAAERRRAMGGWDSYSEVSPILAALATVYADHVDYREEWRP